MKRILIIVALLFTGVLAEDGSVTVDAINELWGNAEKAFFGAGGTDVLSNSPDFEVVDKVIRANYERAIGSATEIVQDATQADRETRGWKIASGFVSWYSKVRTVVRYTYEEIKYWQALEYKFKRVIGFFDDLNDQYVKFKKEVKSFIHNDESLTIYDRAKKYLELVDGLENLANAPKTFDRRIAELEVAWDNMVRDEFSYSVEGLYTQSMRWTPGQLVPNTKEILDYVDKSVFYGRSSLLQLEAGAEWFSSINNKKDLAFLDTAHGDMSEEIVGTDPYRYYSLPIVSNQLVATSAVANSLEYRKWAMVAMEDLYKTEKELTVILGETVNKGGITGADVGSAWYSILMVNANNKYILHSLEEARLQQALIGTELHIKSSARHNELNSDWVILREPRD
jgi:hypothetical protein